MQISSIGQSFAPTDRFEYLFCELYTSQRRGLYEFIVSRVHIAAVAEDILQDVFLKLWSSKDRCVASVENYKAFLFRMAHNETISLLRKEKLGQKVFKHMSKSIETELNLTEQVVYSRQLETLLQQAIQTLSPQRKKVYVLGKIEGISLEQIAVEMGIATRTVTEMMRVSNQQVRKYINKQMDMNRKRKYNCIRKATIKTAIAKVNRLEAA